MGRLKLSLACGPYDLLSGLIDGTAVTSGLDLNVLTMASPERHRRMLRYEEFDVCELSLGGYLIAREAGKAFTAIPAFPHRPTKWNAPPAASGCGWSRSAAPRAR